MLQLSSSWSILFSFSKPTLQVNRDSLDVLEGMNRQDAEAVATVKRLMLSRADSAALLLPQPLTATALCSPEGTCSLSKHTVHVGLGRGSVGTGAPPVCPL